MELAGFQRQLPVEGSQLICHSVGWEACSPFQRPPPLCIPVPCPSPRAHTPHLPGSCPPHFPVTQLLPSFKVPPLLTSSVNLYPVIPGSTSVSFPSLPRTFSVCTIHLDYAYNNYEKSCNTCPTRGFVCPEQQVLPMVFSQVLLFLFNGVSLSHWAMMVAPLPTEEMEENLKAPSCIQSQGPRPSSPCSRIPQEISACLHI